MENFSEKFNISDLFFESAKKYPDKIAIVYKENIISFRELEKQVLETAVYFHQKGIRKGDRVLIFVQMSIDLYRIVLAIFKIGATAVFLDEWVSKKRMEECCRTAQCKAFIRIFKARVFSWFSFELRKIPLKLGTSYSRNNSGIDFPLTTKDDTALITFTTGSTGTPKAAKRSHGFLFEQFKALQEVINPEQGEINMPVLPIVLLLNLGTGTTSVIADFKSSKPEEMSAEKIAKQILSNKVISITASPFFIRKLSEYLLAHKLFLPVKKIITGGAPVFPAEAEKYIRAFPEAKIEIAYGSTEAEPVSSITADVLVSYRTKSFSSGLLAGKIHSSANVKIIPVTDSPLSLNSREDFENLSLPSNSIGEIIVSGKHVLREYFNNEEARRRNKIIVEDVCWHRTGDSGFLDEKGNLFLTGRCSGLIARRGKYISQFMYETFFSNEAGLFGTAMEIEGKIIIVAQGEKQIKHVIEEKLLQQNMLYDKVEMLEKIPRDPRHNSKIDYPALAKKLRSNNF